VIKLDPFRRKRAKREFQKLIDRGILSTDEHERTGIVDTKALHKSLYSGLSRHAKDAAVKAMDNERVTIAFRLFAQVHGRPHETKKELVDWLASPAGEEAFNNLLRSHIPSWHG
jgi:hypothetical protein